MKQAEYQQNQERIAPHRDVSADTTLHSRAVLLSQVPSVDTTAVTVLPKNLNERKFSFP
jgi:hypothetical protein